MSVDFSEDITPLPITAIWVGKKETRRLSRWLIKAIKTKGGVTFVLSEYIKPSLLFSGWLVVRHSRDTLNKKVEPLYKLSSGFHFESTSIIEFLKPARDRESRCKLYCKMKAVCQYGLYSSPHLKKF